MKYMKKLIVFLVIVVLSAGICSNNAHAYQIDKAYTYNKQGDTVASPNVYQVKQIIDGAIEEFGRLSNPEDIYVDDQDYIYILDSGNCRVVILDNEYNYVKELKEFSYKGEPTTLASGASGIFFREATQSLYIADTKNDRILMSDLDGEISRIYDKPVSSLLDETITYKPKKLVVDNMGTLYVVSENVNTGAIMVDEENNFLGFYGTNEIKQTAKVIVEYMWRRFLTEEQQRFLVQSFQPVQFNNIFWSSNRFIYAVSPENEELETSVSRLNVQGENTFPSDAVFGIQGDESLDSLKTQTSFVDITVNDDKFFTVIDTISGKLYYYDEECNLIAAFGGKGYQKGLFTQPSALETNSMRDLMVLDKVKGTITVMEQSYYGTLISDASSLHNQGLYLEALEKWEEVLLMNANCHLAYTGLGKAYMNLEDYHSALYYFELAGDQENYSKAKGEIREEWLHENFVLLAVMLVIIVVAILLFDQVKKCLVVGYRVLMKKEYVSKRVRATGFGNMSVYRYPFYIMLHPYDGFLEMKANKKASLKAASLIVLSWIFVENFYRSMTVFDVNPFYFDQISILETTIVSLIVYAMVCIANWCFCSLLNGKGKMKDIFVVVAYSLIPYIISRFAWVLLSNIFTIDEQVLFSYVVVLTKIWCVIMVFLGLKEIHEYSAKKTLLSLALTIVGVVIMLFLGILFVLMTQQLYTFILKVLFELKY